MLKKYLLDDNAPTGRLANILAPTLVQITIGFGFGLRTLRMLELQLPVRLARCLYRLERCVCLVWLQDGKRAFVLRNVNVGHGSTLVREPSGICHSFSFCLRARFVSRSSLCIASTLPDLTLVSHLFMEPLPP